ncbi:hypothetical protein ACW180_06410 [Limosilactobacillus fermentum]
MIIIGSNGEANYEYSMLELAELAQANHMEVIDRLDQSTGPTPLPTLVRGRLRN